MRLFLYEARRQIRSIVGLCEDFGDRGSRAKRTHKNDFRQDPQHFHLRQGGYLLPAESC